MATSVEYVEFVCDQIAGVGKTSFKKMFGEYMVYVNDKPILLVCDNTVYVKQLPIIKEQMKDAELGCPYEGAPEQYILYIENPEFSKEIVTLLEKITPLPKKKKKKAKPQPQE